MVKWRSYHLLHLNRSEMKENRLDFKNLKNFYNEIITESGGVQEVVAPSLKPPAEE
jgi:queuine/archaeosine tRNA-ribosyltransferase